jgi:UDP-N-acetylmuramoyl-tripeptide--D-alanyl-D-alanine ligase
METLPLSQIAAWSGGAIARGEGTVSVRRLHTDTRTVEPGDCFVALVGETFDGHDFLAVAASKGAVAALVSRIPADAPAGLALIQVADTLKGLQDVAHAYRLSLPVKVVAVTGSSGKTSTKEMLAAVLRRRFRVHATKGNLNNHIGVPLTLLQLSRDDEFAIVEMGMNRRGEIAALAKIARPDLAVITGVGTAHIENLGSREEIAAEKTDLLAALPKDGVAILNADEPLLRAREGRAPRVVWTGAAAGADWHAENILVTETGLAFDLVHGVERAPVTLPVFNRVMAANALLAAAVGDLAEVPLAEIAAGLGEVKLVGGRMEARRRLDGWIIDDCYNANPESTRAALEALQEFPAPARRVAVLGSMGELGAHAPALHRETGAAVPASGAAFLACVGPHAADLAAGAREAGFPADAIVSYATTADAAAALPVLLRANDTVLVKGSRFLKLEQVVAALSGGGVSVGAEGASPTLH